MLVSSDKKLISKLIHFLENGFKTSRHSITNSFLQHSFTRAQLSSSWNSKKKKVNNRELIYLHMISQGGKRSSLVSRSWYKSIDFSIDRRVRKKIHTYICTYAVSIRFFGKDYVSQPVLVADDTTYDTMRNISVAQK